MSIKYVALGPMRGKTFKIPGHLVVKDGEVDVPDGLHEKYGRVLMEDWGVCPAHLVQEVPSDPVPFREEVIVGDTESVVVQIPVEDKPTIQQVVSGKGRRK